MTDDGWRRPNVVVATLDIILPVASGLVAMLVLPMVLVSALKHYLPTMVNDKSLCQSSSSFPLSGAVAYILNVYCPIRAVLYFYPGIFVVACIARGLSLIQTVAAGWAQSIRDSEFLVEMKLRNLDPAPPPPPLEPVPSSSGSSVAPASADSPPSSPASMDNPDPRPQAG